MIHKLHGGEATHAESVPVKEVFRADGVGWNRGSVRSERPPARRIAAYAWCTMQTDNPTSPARHRASHSPWRYLRRRAVRAVHRPGVSGTMTQPKPKKSGRPKLPKGEAKAVIVRVRLTPEERKAIETRPRPTAKRVRMDTRKTFSVANRSVRR